MGKIKTRDLVTMALLTALLYVGQVGMSFLPNVEIVSLLVIVYTQVYKKKVFLMIYVFAILEGLTYGFGIWWFGYLYVWTILAIVVLLLHKHSSVIVMSIVSAAFGLSFGFLFSIPYFITGGVGAGLAYFVAGIPYDIIHCVANAIVCVVLYKPIHALLCKLVFTQQHEDAESNSNKIA